MRFSVDAHAIGRHLTGNEVYIRNLLNGFAGLDRTSEFIAYLCAHSAEVSRVVPSRFTQRYVSRNSFLRLGIDLSRQLRRDKPDLIHVQYTAPFGCPVPVVVSVHDVSFLEHPEYFPRSRRMQLRITVKQTVERAAKILTPSEFSRQAIARAYDIDQSKIVVVPIAVSSSFHPIAREVAAGKVAARFNIPSPFILTVGDLQPRKNHLGLLHAFEETLRQHPHLPHRLVFVGKETWYSKELHRAVMRSNVAGRVHFTGFVEDPDLLQFYGACDLFVFPAFYEGFGLPILEAMACGRAVACSSATAMPEVANAAGILFDPYSVPEMARAIGDVLLDEEMRVRLERLGSNRAASFTWERAAQRTLDVYYEVAGVGKPVPAMKLRASSST